MPKIKNASGADLTVPALGGRLVVDGEVVEVPDGEVYGFTCQESNWSPADAAAKREHERAHKAQLELNAPPPPAEEPTEDPVDSEDQADPADPADPADHGNDAEKEN